MLFLKGIYLVEPHGKLIASGKKTAIVKSRGFLIAGQNLVLVSGKLAYGLISLKKPKIISLFEFRKRFEDHQISHEDRKKWWPDKRRLYLFDINKKFIFDKPIPVDVPRGIQTMIGDVDLEKKSDFGLDLKTLVPSKMANDVLADYFRKSAAWISSIEAGKKFKYSKEEVLVLAKKIIAEMKKRGFKFHVEKMKPSTKKLFDTVNSFGAFASIYRGTESERFDTDLSVEDFNDAWSKPMVLVKDYVSLVGSVVNWGKSNTDADILIKKNSIDAEEDMALMFRLSRAFENPDVRKRLHFLADDFHGPFTSNISFYDLVLMPSKENGVIQEMSASRIDSPKLNKRIDEIISVI